MTHSSRLLLMMMTTSLAACMMKHSEPPEVVADGVSLSAPEEPIEVAELEEELDSPDDSSRLSRGTEGQAAATGGEARPKDAVAAHDPVPEAEPAVTAQLGALGYVASDSDSDMSERAEEAAPSNRSGRRDNANAPARPQSITAARPAPSGGAAVGGIIGDLSSLDYAAAPPPPPVEEDRASSTEEYTDYGVNGFTLVDQDALSTFSIDVDTASYTVARRKLTEGGLPPIASVRVEEFVNYFDYEYAPPAYSATHPFNVHFEAFPDPFRAGRHIMRVGVQAKEIPVSERPPLHLTFLVDVSGSMSSADKLPLAQQAMHMLVDTLQEGDTVALATYAGRTAEILQPTDVTNKSAIHEALGALQSGGSTAMSSGLDIAYNMALRSFEEGAENRVIVLSDGDANVGSTGWDSMLGQIKDKANMGITMSTVGLGMGNYRDTLMEQLANNGDGNNYYIDSRQQAQRVFVEEMAGTIFTVARDVKIQVEFNDDSVSAYRLLGYENRDIADRDFRNDRVDAGEIGSGHNVTALYEVILKEGYADTLATVRLRYEAPGADKAATEVSFPFPDQALKELDSQAGQNTRIAYAAATFAEILRDSPNTNEMSLDAVIAFAEQARRSGEKDDAELIKLMKKARTLGAGDGIGVAGR
ncbi:MAG: Ca-activated chloride channel family protein [Myxococcota bacterium]|jgi:Ca-activated chloride channel family protein